MPELQTTSTVIRIPKKDDQPGFHREIHTDDPKYVYAWGLEAKLVVSACCVLVYHFLIFLLPFGFWGWWIAKHPSDMQGASVPVSVVLGLLSLFWLLSGILTEGRHGTSANI
jgi:hypothetical protein